MKTSDVLRRIVAVYRNSLDWAGTLLVVADELDAAEELRRRTLADQYPDDFGEPPHPDGETWRKSLGKEQSRGI